MADGWHENSSKRFEASRFSKLLSSMNRDFFFATKSQWDVCFWDCGFDGNVMLLFPEVKSSKSQKEQKSYRKRCYLISKLQILRNKQLWLHHQHSYQKLYTYMKRVIGWTYHFDHCIKFLIVRELQREPIISCQNSKSTSWVITGLTSSFEDSNGSSKTLQNHSLEKSISFDPCVKIMPDWWHENFCNRFKTSR